MTEETGRGEAESVGEKAKVTIAELSHLLARIDAEREAFKVKHGEYPQDYVRIADNISPQWLIRFAELSGFHVNWYHRIPIIGIVLLQKKMLEAGFMKMVNP